MTLQETIIAQLGVKPSIDPKEEIRKSVDFLKAYMLKHPFLKTYVLGISGGQDSTLAGRLAQLAIEELRAETGKDYQFIAIRLPYGVQADEDDAQRALTFIKPDVSLAVNIKEAVDGQVAELAKAGVTVSDFNKGNIKARQRMITQYAVAGENSGAVIGCLLYTCVKVQPFLQNLVQTRSFMKKCQQLTWKRTNQESLMKWHLE